MHLRTVILSLLAGVALTGCATYTPMPLPRHAHSNAAVPLLTMPTAAFKTPGVHVIRLDPKRPLNADDVAALAVLNNPALTAVRAKRGLVTAQSYAAGLLPWPQITIGAGRPRPSAAGLGNTWSLALDQEITGMVQHHSRERAARDVEARVRLDVIWDEWQVAQQARLRYADIEMISAERAAIQPLARLYEGQFRAAQADANAHGLSQSSVLEVQAARAAIIAELGALEVRYDKDRSALHRLLGLAANVPLSLALDDHPSAPDKKAVQAAIAALPDRRPDLMAVAAAYRHAGERLRQAVMAQFPLIGISVHRERDTEGVADNGFSLTFSLPFLNDARGNIAVARASRMALHANYEARLNDAAVEATAMKHEVDRLQAVLTELHKGFSRLPGSPEAAALGTVSFDRLAAYTRARTQTASRIARLQHSLDQAIIALDTLLGMPLDTGHKGDHA